MKTDLWAVFLWPDAKVVGGASLDRMVSDAVATLAERSILRPVVVVSLHSSASAADRAAIQIGDTLRPSGWWICEKSAECERQRMEEEE